MPLSFNPVTSTDFTGSAAPDFLSPETRQRGVSPLAFRSLDWHPTGNATLEWSLDRVSGPVGHMVVELRGEGL